MWDCSSRDLILSNITTPDVSEKSVAIEIKAATEICVLSGVPFPGVTATLSNVPQSKKVIPGWANFRAAVVEK
jgi:hypothetical protein